MLLLIQIQSCCRQVMFSETGSGEIEHTSRKWLVPHKGLHNKHVCRRSPYWRVCLCCLASKLVAAFKHSKSFTFTRLFLHAIFIVQLDEYNILKKEGLLMCCFICPSCCAHFCKPWSELKTFQIKSNFVQTVCSLTQTLTCC